MNLSKRVMAMFAIILLCAFAVSGCRINKTTLNVGEGTGYNLMNVEDSSELQNWGGEQLKLTYWEGHGVGGGRKIKKSVNDVVSPEIKRVSGITIDEENSYDNGAGQTFDVKLSMLAASNDWPSLVLNAGNLKQLVDADKVYDLTELIPKYCPNIVKKIPLNLKSVWQDDVRVSAGIDGKIYAVATDITEAGYRTLNEGIDQEKYNIFAPPDDSRGYVWVRDDVLKKLYPKAKSQDEITEIFKKNKRFSKEEILDVTFKTKKEFVDFLYNVKQLNLVDNGQTVYPFYLSQGLDNWYLLNDLTGWLDGKTTQNGYFTYFDKLTGKVEFGYNKPEFKETLRQWNMLLRDGIVSKEDFLNNNSSFTERVNRGYYSVMYKGAIPDNKLLESQGKNYKYRKVYIDIPVDYNKYYVYSTLPNATNCIAIFKNKVNEKQVIQILRWLDFMVSDTGEKLSAWGPKSAKLWENIDGKRQFLDSDMADCMAYGVDNGMDLQYNLLNASSVIPNSTGKLMPTYVRNAHSKFAPAYVYDRKYDTIDVSSMFYMGYVEQLNKVSSRKPDLWNYTSIPEVDRAWKSRKNFEDALLKVMTAFDDTQFEKFYNDFISVAVRNGYDDKLANIVEKAFRKLNSDRMENLK